MSIRPHIPHRWNADPPLLGQPEFCEAWHHAPNREKPKARYYHTTNKVWICACCAAAENRWLVTQGMEARCITAEEYTFRLLTQL